LLSPQRLKRAEVKETPHDIANQLWRQAVVEGAESVAWDGDAEVVEDAAILRLVSGVTL
jgi:hypothetical protein